jgi:hypothetical protein
MSGLAGFHLLRDPSEVATGLLSGKYEMPIVIQDRIFMDDSSMYFSGESTCMQNHSFYNLKRPKN